MYCERVEIAGGVGFICRGGRRPRCSEAGCNGEVAALCDFELRAGAKRKTCDRKLCARHAVRQPGKGSDGSDRRDLCPAHERVVAAACAPPP